MAKIIGQKCSSKSVKSKERLFKLNLNTYKKPNKYGKRNETKS